MYGPRTAAKPRPASWAVIGAASLALLGAIFGLVESVRDYPLASWFGVTLYVAVLGASAGFVLGLIAGVCGRVFVGAKVRGRARAR